jgi:hypothetical protein
MLIPEHTYVLCSIIYMFAALLKSSDDEADSDAPKPIPIAGFESLLQSDSDDSDQLSAIPLALASRLPAPHTHFDDSIVASLDFQAPLADSDPSVVSNLPFALGVSHGLIAIASKAKLLAKHVRTALAMIFAPLDRRAAPPLAIADSGDLSADVAYAPRFLGPCESLRDHAILANILQHAEEPEHALVQTNDISGIARTLAARTQIEQQLGHALERAAYIVQYVNHPRIVSSDLGVDRMVLELLESTGMHISSAAADAQKFDTDPHNVSKYKRLAASATYVMSRRDAEAMTRGLIADVKRLGGVCLTWTEKIKADETSLSLKVFDTEVATLTPAPDASVSSLATQTQQLATLSSAQKATTKILQTMLYYSLLFRVPPQNTYLFVHFEVITPLQMMFSTKADVYYACFVASSLLAMSFLGQEFNRRQRLATSDADPSPALALRGIAKTTGVPNWHTKCGPHLIANITDYVMLPMEHHVSRMIKLQLSLHNANSMRSLRDITRLAIDELLDWSRGRADEADMRFITACLDSYLPSSTRANRFKRVVVRMLLNGPWWKHGVLVHKCSGCCKDRDDCVNKLCCFFVIVFVALGPPLWPRHRWKGARASKNWMCLLESCHGFLTVLYPRWASVMRGGKWVQEWLARGGPSAFDALADALPDLEGERVPDDADGGGARPSVEPSSGVDDGRAAAKAKEEAKRKEQDQFRTDACSWILRDAPYASLVVMGVVIDILEGMIDTFLDQAGVTFEGRREAEAAARSADVGEEDIDMSSLRVFMCLDGVFTKPALALVVKFMHDPRAWDMLPWRLATASLRARAGCMLSSIACHVSGMQAEYDNFPIAVFDVLRGNSPWKSDLILALPPCRLDAWTEDLVASYGEAGLDQPDCKADLRGTAMMQEFDMCNVETGHSVIRRGIYIRSCQTHQVVAVDASSDFVLRRMRRMTKDGPKLSKVPSTTATPKQRGAGVGEQSPTNSRGGGAWRAFVRETLLGKRQGEVMFDDLSVLYKNLDPIAKQRFVDLGKAAVVARNAGGSSFGLKTRGAERASAKRIRCAEIEAIQSDVAKRARLTSDVVNGGELVHAFVRPSEDAVVAHGGDWSKLVRLKTSMALERRAQLERRECIALKVKEWDDSQGKSRVGQVGATLPNAKDRSTDFVCNPLSSKGFVALEWRPNSVGKRVRRALRLKGNTQAAKALFAKLSRAWDGLHTTVQHEPIKVLKEVTPAKVARPCHAAGRCIHRGIGAQQAKLASQLDSTIKSAIKECAELKDMFAKAEVALFLFGQTNEMLDGRSHEPPSMKCVHVGHLSLSPWFMRLHQMSTDFVPASGGEVVFPRRARALFENIYFQRFAFAATFNLKLTWSVCVTSVIFEERLLPGFLPNCLDLEPVNLVNNMRVFWDPSKLDRSFDFHRLLGDSSDDDEEASTEHNAYSSVKHT